MPEAAQVETQIGLLLRRVLVHSAADDLEGAIADLKLALSCAREKDDRRLEVTCWWKSAVSPAGWTLAIA
ncbi:MAG: hypothetical protein ACREYF_19540 [Gammaproteobacteria bacterium]